MSVYIFLNECVWNKKNKTKKNKMWLLYVVRERVREWSATKFNWI